MRSNLILLGICLVALVVAGCSPEAKEQKHLDRAQAHVAAGDYDRAEIEYLNTLRLNRTNLPALRGLAQVALDQGRLGRAFALYTEAAKHWPDDFESRLRLAALRLPAGRTPELHAEVEQLVGRQPDHPEALALWADSAPATNDLRELQRRLVAREGTVGRTAGYQVALGTLLVRQGDAAGAEQAFRRALEIDPRHGKAHVGLGALEQLRKDLPGALREFKAAADLAGPRSTDRLRYGDALIASGDAAAARQWLESVTAKAPDFLPALVRLAQLALAEGRPGDCERLLRAVLDRDPAYLDAMLLMARLRQLQNDPARAVVELENAARAYPRLTQVHYLLAVAHVANGDTASAIRRLKEALGVEPDQPEVIRMLADLYLRRGDAKEAVTLLERLTQRRPDDQAVQMSLASAHQGTGDFAAALAVYQSMANQQRTNPQPVVLEGLMQARLGRTAEAQAAFERALVLDPDHLPAAEQLLHLDVLAQRPAAAEARAQRQVERAPNKAGPQVLLAKAYLARTNYALAEQALLKAIDLEPEQREASWILARVYVVKGQHIAALERFAGLLASNTNNVAVMLQIADVHMALTNSAAAAEYYEKVLKVNPRSAPALNNLAWLLAEELGEPARAIELSDRARAERPDDPALTDTAGWVAFRNGNYPRALALIRESAQRLGNHPEVLFHLGMIHYMMGEEVPARVALENAVQLAPDARWRAEATGKLRILNLAPGGGVELVEQLQALRESSPNDPLLHLRLATALERMGEWRQAAAAYEQAIALNSSLVKALLQLARVNHYQLANAERATELIRRARELDADDPVIGHLLGKLTHDGAKTPSDYQLAFGLLQSAATARPRDAEIVFDFARATYSLGQASNAVVQMRRVTEMPPPSAWTAAATDFLAMEALRSQVGSVIAGDARIQTLADSRPPLVPAILVQGLVKEQTGDMVGARTIYESLLKRFPLCALADVSLARVLVDPAINDIAKAFEHASKARAAYPSDASVARLLGQIAFLRSDFTRAAQLLEEASAGFPSDAALYYDLGFALQNLKQVAPARAALGRAVSLSPNSPRAEKARQALTNLK